jgi:hypothetical protein
MRLRTGKRKQRRDLHGIAPRALGALAAPITAARTTKTGATPVSRPFCMYKSHASGIFQAEFLTCEKFWKQKQVSY